MTRIDGVGPPIRPVPRAGQQRSGFDPAIGRAPAATPAEPLAAPSSLLSLQEADRPDDPRRREGRRRAASLIDLLARLHLQLLSDEDPTIDLRDLAELSEIECVSGDARLDAILRGLRVRAHVELARRNWRSVATESASPCAGHAVATDKNRFE